MTNMSASLFENFISFLFAWLFVKISRKSHNKKKQCVVSLVSWGFRLDKENYINLLSIDIYEEGVELPRKHMEICLKFRWNHM